ncbi:MAG: Hsp33 family molecular chaperone HslO [Sandaracinaceae bacterium]|jgi:molecular chaperone Hsp33|nr:Hsp33 family molecular chaperone HslO [Sandaracinaceae bacterium]MBK7775685.1 Hsp33 family molecular chaperone HslO [Sandaracinaceae bacterium]MBK8409434.1 Hsp33 family molecular chaperone HslO [Sandaracinaceae bacterium]MBK8591994.1 Hsp33 family molecular chaperone HslO [Sandaracinaceae bacterium]MBP7681587.1 Hsp33 family molecular chaperone HslO [Deltaproteobacteria bacterium]
MTSAGNTAAQDRALRAMTDDGAFRLIAARVTDTVRGVVAAQKLEGEGARQLGQLVAAAVLYRETMAPTLRVQLALQGAAGSGHLLADSNPEGWSRGLSHRTTGERVQLEGGMLQMIRSLPNGDLHRGVVQMPESGNISEGFMSYMQSSEQIATMVAVDVVLGAQGEVVAAGGYLVQILPEYKEREGALALMTFRLEDFQDISERLRLHDASPDHLVEEIFYGMDYTLLGDSPLRFGCNCSKERVMASLHTLGADDLLSLIEAGDELDMSCDHCGTPYMVSIPELEAVAATKARRTPGDFTEN